MSHTHQLFTLVFLSLLLCARLHFSGFFSRATQRAPVLPPTRCKLPQKKGIYGGYRGLICLRFPDCCRASLIYMLCSPRCPDFCHVSRLYCPFLYLLLLQAHLYLFIFWQCFTSCIFHFYLSIS